MKLTWKKNTSNTNKISGNRKRPAIVRNPNLPFDNNQDYDNNGGVDIQPTTSRDHSKELASSSSTGKQPDDSSRITSSSDASLADEFLEQGNKLAQDGKYGKALGKWEAAIMLMPEKAVLHEQKAQVLLELGDAWGALKAASRAAELDPSWAEAWITLGRAQLNFGEPDDAIDSFDRASALKPELNEVQDDRQTAVHLVKKRKQLHSAGLNTNEVRFMVGEKSKSS